MRFDWIDTLPFWPDQISDHAATVDTIMVAFSFVMVLFVAPIFVLMAFFAFKYRRGSKADRMGRPRSLPWLEATWALVPLVVMMVFFYQAARAYFDMHDEMENALRIEVIGKQWMWKTQHPNGKRQINQLNVPVGVPVVLNMISQDVIHSMYLPALRIKQDVLPHRYTKLRFVATETGTFHLTCAEYCGTLHSRMGGSLVVMEREAYDAWVEEAPDAVAPVERGRRLFTEAGCRGCHAEDAPVEAPLLDGLYGSAVPLAGGGSVEADDNYLRTAILRPNAHVVAGFDPIMPSFRQQLDEAQILDLIAYIQALPTGGREQGEGR
ncbi:Cytochrome c oxidase polypeptide II [Caenispirillum salinarum AK4]|uniref:cytochrome-c oxidase n=1 Tax=Caenispirillum salinarum AK4 TaxID=1238182 RepID=K9GWA6_9PROT|nr:cytochrome c oxidase subunit II [Caenispirillum salinarum]EKV29537.1 Cytochrome c oxidase polypeptide II [Caenispirillum salinarum AK4]